MNAAEPGRQHPDEVSVGNAKQTLLQLLARAGVFSGDAEELIGLIEAGALTLAHRRVDAAARNAPAGKGPLYEAGWVDGGRAVADELGLLAERALLRAVAADPSDTPATAGSPPGTRPPVRRMQVDRAKVAVVPLYLSFTAVSDLDPEVSEQVLTAVLGTMGPRQRADYAGRLTAFVSGHRERLERLYGEFGPGSRIAVHGRYSLLHSPTSIAVLERLATEPAALREEWDAAELPPAWLEGLAAAWGAPD
ncbi:hypothetical protein BJP40_15540 [Streptomyces sp. CC53]|uniref:hypothetical protein n=1 Tax=unclassified Streptomyces TaxID=2593676 RepID=UPI0008DCFB00|nr:MULTISPECIES: hypothetical protein [unclassified Streptomyces]OII65852.1 hypothetical protein BJP40_15540 [Streptomyces sp. CC53]